ncbi:MAG: hypothetical protein ACO294_03030 [Methylococcales bacterium]|jgi:hypothetical protein
MTNLSGTELFDQLHIDVARNATDDFNLFHDSKKWQYIKNNPFNGTIVLGFQLESLIEHKVLLYRQIHKEQKLISDNKLRFSNYHFSFVNAVKPRQLVSIDIKESQLKKGENTTLSNRITVKADGLLALMGSKKESQVALFLPNLDLPKFDKLRLHPDRSFLPNGIFFLKRKFINISNAKNFLCGSLVDQDDYFDDIHYKAIFPEIFPCSLISCALLEKAQIEQYDFEQNPMVYLSHKISIDRMLLEQLKSNDALHLLVKQLSVENESTDQIGHTEARYDYECYGLIKDNAVLFRALISLAPLDKILKLLKR